MKSRRTINFNLSLLNSNKKKSSPYVHKMYTSMFLDDVFKFIIPYTNDFDIKLENDDRKLDLLIFESMHRFQRSRFRGEIKDFLRDYVHQLASLKDICFEVVYNKRKKEFDLYEFPINTFKYSFLKQSFYQEIPDKIFKKDNVSDYIDGKIKEKNIYLEKKNIFILNLPPEIKREMKLCVSILKKLDKNSNKGIKNLEFWKLDEDGNSLYPFYNYQKAIRKEKRMLLEVSKITGWTARSMCSEVTTEFYNIYSILSFMEFKRHILDYILVGLNGLLDNITKELNFQSNKFIVEGCLSLEEIDNLKNDLLNGKKSTKEIVDIIYK